MLRPTYQCSGVTRGLQPRPPVSGGPAAVRRVEYVLLTTVPCCGQPSHTQRRVVGVRARVTGCGQLSSVAGAQSSPRAVLHKVHVIPHAVTSSGRLLHV